MTSTVQAGITGFRAPGSGNGKDKTSGGAMGGRDTPEPGGSTEKAGAIGHMTTPEERQRIREGSGLGAR